MRIIVDVMGGDNAPDAIALGAIEAAKEEWKVDIYLEPGEAWALNAGFFNTPSASISHRIGNKARTKAISFILTYPPSITF